MMVAKGTKRQGEYPTAQYIYRPGDPKHAYEQKVCPTCGEEHAIRRSNTFCSYRCSKLGALNPSKQKAAGHGLTASEYATVHSKVRRTRGSAHGCAHCGTTEDRMYHWANISGNYHDVQDYVNLCVPCHDTFDRAGKGGE